MKDDREPEPHRPIQPVPEPNFRVHMFWIAYPKR